MAVALELAGALKESLKVLLEQPECAGCPVANAAKNTVYVGYSGRSCLELRERTTCQLETQTDLLGKKIKAVTEIARAIQALIHTDESARDRQPPEGHDWTVVEDASLAIRPR